MKIVLAVIFSLLLWSPVHAYDDTPSKEDVAGWKAAAKKGDPEAEYNLAEAYQKGEGGLIEDMQEAVKWYEKSAIQGYADAQFAMGFVYRGGDGVPMDKVLSYVWFDIAAKNGDDRAFNLRNDVAWSMSEPEINEARKLSGKWKTGQKIERIRN